MLGIEEPHKKLARISARITPMTQARTPKAIILRTCLNQSLGRDALRASARECPADGESYAIGQKEDCIDRPTCAIMASHVPSLNCRQIDRASEHLKPLCHWKPCRLTLPWDR